jgi:hypoxanthine phosphoribosyltransferase
MSKAGLHVLYTREEVAETVTSLAVIIREDYQDRHPLLVGILKGSFVFMADLIRLLDFPLEVDFVRLASYGSGTESSGKVEIMQDLHCQVKDRDILIVEDIIDTGLTTSFLIDYLKKRKPHSLKLCALADKPSRRKVTVHIDYLGFTVPDKFLVGYGIDWNENYRNLPDICFIEEKS